MQITQDQVITVLNSKLADYQTAVTSEQLIVAGSRSLKDFLFGAIINASPIGKMLIKDLADEFKTEPHTVLRVLFSKP